MIRLATIVILSFLLTGCLATTTTSKPSDGDAELFSRGLQSLEQKGSTVELNKLASMKPSSEWSDYAKSILKIHTSQQKSINALKKKSSSLRNENNKLQDNLDKLNQINLELEKRTH